MNYKGFVAFRHLKMAWFWDHLAPFLDPFWDPICIAFDPQNREDSGHILKEID